MTILDLKEHWLRTAAAAGIALAVGFGAPAWAQDEEAPPEAPPAEEEEAAAEVVEEAEEEAAKEDKIVVTGSRLGRDEFSSPAPVQIISGEVSRETGLVDTAALLQESTVATGTQIDRTFSAFVLDNGPGGTPIDLRGLDPNRTLVMINGRRLAPAGIEGAPVAPDLSLVPSALVERFEILLDGASSVYGSDAVAGVVNVILKKDMEGFNLEWFQTQPQAGNGEETVVSATWGATSDRSFIGFGAEYSRRDNIQLRDRDFSSECQKHAEITTDGEIRTDDVLTASQFPGMAVQPCYFFLANRMFVNGFGSIYWTPGETNIGIPGWTESGLFGFAFNENGERIQGIGAFPGFGGTVPVDFSDPLYNLNGQDRDADLVQPQENFLFYSFGEHEFDWLGHTMTAYFEASYANRRGVSDFGPAQLFPDVPASNPFNPCGENGVDCGAAFNNVAGEPADAIGETFFGFDLTPEQWLAAFGVLQAEGPSAVTPIVRIRGDRNKTEFELSQVRTVGGFRGDVAFMDNWGLNNWTYDIHGSYTRSVGSTLRRGILEDRLMLSLLTTQEDPENPGEYICGLDVDGDTVPDPEGQVGPLFATAAPNCVPVNLFAPSIYLPGGGDFATQEERDFVFGRRGFNTVVEQTVLQGIVKGDAFDLPAGTVSALVGFEYREDKIDSEPDDNAEDGNFILFFNDGGADGSRDLYEAFAEVRIPVLAGLPFAEEFTIEASGRWTEEQFFGSGITYSVKGFYRPTNFLTLRGTYGTSFRAPNLREQFLNSQTGFLFVSDPCEVPDSAGAGSGVYDPNGDRREQQTIDNCILAGVDPFSLGLFGGGPSSEISNEGNTDLQEETSTSFTAGIVFEQPFFESFNLTLGASYWNIDVNNSIQEPSPNFVLTECFVAQPNLSSPFCDRIGRSEAGFVNFVDTRFINVSEDKASGIDFDVVFRKDIRVFDEMLSLSADVDATYSLEREIAITGAGGIFTSDLDGEPNFPIWRGIGRLLVDFKDFRFVWQTRYISGTENDNPDAFGAADTCLGEAAGDVDCTDINFIDDYWEHDMSLAYIRDTWTLRFGIRNVLDTDPPFVDPTEILTINGATNVPAGGSFDLFGRTYFINVAKKW